MSIKLITTSLLIPAEMRDEISDFCQEVSSFSESGRNVKPSVLIRYAIIELLNRKKEILKSHDVKYFPEKIIVADKGYRRTI